MRIDLFSCCHALIELPEVFSLYVWFIKLHINYDQPDDE